MIMIFQLYPHGSPPELRGANKLITKKLIIVYSQARELLEYMGMSYSKEGSEIDINNLKLKLAEVRLLGPENIKITADRLWKYVLRYEVIANGIIYYRHTLVREKDRNIEVEWS